MQHKQKLVIDCAEIARAKTDAALVNELANQTGYYPVFSFLSSINGLIDLASLGLIGQKAGFSTPVDQQLKQILEVVGSALKDVSEENRDAQRYAAESEKKRLQAEQAELHRRSSFGVGPGMMVALTALPVTASCPSWALVLKSCWNRIATPDLPTPLAWLLLLEEQTAKPSQSKSRQKILTTSETLFPRFRCWS